MNLGERREILFFLISLVIVVFAWIGFNVYHNIVTSTIPDSLSSRILSIQSHFDTKTIDSLKKREKIAPILEGVVSTPSPTLTAIPTTTLSITPQSTPTPTLGGQQHASQGALAR